MLKEGEPISDSEEVVETPGHKGEKIVVEFLKNAFPGFITNIEKTESFDPNDKNGIDFVCELEGGHKLAVDVTFDGDERRQSKMEKTFRNPLAVFRDEKGKPVGDKIPRVLLFERSMSLWFLYKDKATKEGVELVDTMDEAVKFEQKRRFVETVLDQVDGLSKFDPAYAEKSKPVRKLFEKEAKLLKVA